MCLYHIDMHTSLEYIVYFTSGFSICQVTANGSPAKYYTKKDKKFSFGVFSSLQI